MQDNVVQASLTQEDPIEAIPKLISPSNPLSHSSTEYSEPSYLASIFGSRTSLNSQSSVWNGLAHAAPVYQVDRRPWRE